MKTQCVFNTEILERFIFFPTQDRNKNLKNYGEIELFTGHLIQGLLFHQYHNYIVIR